MHARIVVRREEDEARVRARIIERLNKTISPLPSEVGDGWRFGQALRRSNVYRLLEQAEPGVAWVDEVRFVLDEAPDGEITALAADRYQLGTWYTGGDEILFRSTNDGDGWEPAGRFPGEQVRVVVPYPEASRPGVVPRAGLVAVATRAVDGSTSSIHVSEDLGESWRRIAGLDVGITDLAWTSRGPVPELLVATDSGLYEVPLLAEAAPIQVLVDAADPDRGFYHVESFTNDRGEWGVAVASVAEQGVYLSTAGGRHGVVPHGRADRPGHPLVVGAGGRLGHVAVGRCRRGRARPARPRCLPRAAVRGRCPLGAHAERLARRHLLGHHLRWSARLRRHSERRGRPARPRHRWRGMAATGRELRAPSARPAALRASREGGVGTGQRARDGGRATRRPPQRRARSRLGVVRTP